MKTPTHANKEEKASYLMDNCDTDGGGDKALTFDEALKCLLDLQKK